MSRSRPSTSRPSDIIRRDLDRHVVMLTALASIVNAHTKELGLYVEVKQEMVEGESQVRYEGVKRGILAEQFVPGQQENVDDYLDRMRREASEAALSVLEGM